MEYFSEYGVVVMKEDRNSKSMFQYYKSLFCRAGSKKEEMKNA